MRRFLFALICLPLIGCSHEPDPKQTAFYQAATELSTALVELKQAGLSTSWDSIDRHVPVAENGAEAYKLAFQMAQAPGVLHLSYGRPDDFLTSREAEPILRSNEKALVQLRKAATYKHCYFGNIRTGAGATPDIEPMLKGARMLALDARFKVRKGDKQGALADIKTMVAVQGHLAESNLELALPIREHISQFCCGAAQQMVSVSNADPAMALALVNEISKEEPQPSLARILPEDILANYEFITEDYDDLSVSVPDPQSFIPVAEAVSGIPKDEAKAALTARFLQLDLKLYALAKNTTLPPGDAYAREIDLIKADSNGDETHSLNKASFDENEFSECRNILKYETRRAVTLAGLSMVANHKPGTEWPKSLPYGSPLDPVNNEPLTYRSDGKGFTVYCIGPGDTYHRIQTANPIDLVSFSYPSTFNPATRVRRSK